MLPSDRTRRKQWCCLPLMMLLSLQLVNYSIGSPIFSNSMQFSQFQTARNIRHLPCVVRVSGLKGVCMFAIDCIKANGTHLGTCIDKFYFGSCCQMKMEDALYNPEINDNSIDSAFPPSYETNYISKKPYNQVSTVALPSSLQPFNTKATTTKRPHVYNNKTYEFVSSSTAKVPQFNTSTVNYSVNFGGFSTTLGTITQRNLTTIVMRDETTTEKMKFTTFQSIQDGHLKNATQTVTKTTTTLPKTTKRTPTMTTTTVKSVAITNKPLKVSSKQPKPSVGVTVKPTTAPIKNVTTQTSKPTPTAQLNRVKVTTRTPPTVVTTVKPLKDKTTLPTTGTMKIKQTTSLSPRRTTTVSSKRSTTTTTPASTSAETTRAPRPNPQPTSEIVKVQPTTIYQDIIASTANPQVFANKNTATTTTTEKTKTSATTAKRTTKKPATTTRLTTKSTTTTTTTPATTTTTTTTTTKAPSTTVKATTASEQLIYSPTSDKSAEQDDQVTTTPGGFYTWTLSSNNVDNTTKSDDWVLISSVSPTTQVLPNADEMSEKQSTIELLEKIPSTIDLTHSILTTSPITTSTTVVNTTPDVMTEYSEEITDPSTTVEEIEPITIDASPEYTTIVNDDSKLPITTEQSEDETQTETVAEEETTNAIDEDDDDEDEDEDDVKTPAVTTESVIDENVSVYANETSDIPTSTMPNLEGIDYKLICGKRMFPEPRIVGGAKASFGRWPWQISLRQWRTSTYLHKCGAALLNENWAISAAHCVDNVPPSDLLLRLGEYDLSIEEEPYGYQERRVQIVASHPQFDPRTFEYDLALLRFYEPVVFQPNIIPVCVPEDDENFIGRNAYVTGWGRLYEDGPLPSVLQEVTVPVIKNDICESMYRSAGYIEHIPHIFICAGWKKGGYDSCEGDSGGPMVIQRNDKRFQLTGVISWGIGCAEPNQPGVYTRISEFRDWINQILQF